MTEQAVRIQRPTANMSCLIQTEARRTKWAFVMLSHRDEVPDH